MAEPVLRDLARFKGALIMNLVAYIIYTRYEKKQAAKSKDSVKSVA